MKFKFNKSLLSCMAITTAMGALVVGVSIGKSSKTDISRNADQTLSVDEVFTLIRPKFEVFSSAIAAEEGSMECNAKAMEAWSSCFQKNSTFTHGALKFYNNVLCMLNKGFPSQVETTLCHFSKSMGINPDKSALPVTVSKSFGGKTVVITVAAPTEAFAISAGYDAKGTVTVNDVNFMTLYWGGSDENSKGFLIEGGPGMGGDSAKHRTYIQWDRTNSSAQFVKIWAANFTSTYLGSTSASSQDNPKGGDRVIFGRATYNATTAASTAQLVLIEGQRGGGDATTPGCFRMFAEGTKGGTVTVAKTNNAKGQTGHAVASDFKDGTEMDAFQGTDSASTANETGNLVGDGNFGGMTISFDKSCADINSGGQAGQPFDGDNVNFTYGPSDVF